MTDQLLQEVDQALRADRMASLWQRHKRALIAVAALLVLGTAANSGWQHYREARGGEFLLRLSEYQQQLDAGKAEEAAQGFAAVAADASGELKTLAQVWQSRALLAAGKKEEAVAVLRQAVGAPNLWSDVACLRLAGLDAAAATPCLAAQTASPLALERAQWAVAEQWHRGENSAALARLEALIADPNTSQDVRARLMQWRTVMQVERPE